MLLKQVEYKVAALHRTFRVATWVIEGRPFDQPDQHRYLVNFQLGQRLTEEILTGKTKAMNRTLTILANKHLIEISLEDFLLAVMNLQQDRHHGLSQLAAQAALVGQVEVLHQLLSQRTAALTHLALRGIDPDRTGNGLG